MRIFVYIVPNRIVSPGLRAGSGCWIESPVYGHACDHQRAGPRGAAVNSQADRLIRTKIGCVAPLALIAGTVSYLHMHMLVELQGQPGWVVTLTRLSVDGMIVAASTTLLADCRSGECGRVLAWALTVARSVAPAMQRCRGRR